MLITILSGKFSLIQTVEYFGFLKATKYNSGAQIVPGNQNYMKWKQTHKTK